jgi:Secretion system C-terminal sorting domain
MLSSLTPSAAWRLSALIIALLSLSVTAPAQTRVLFVGNSFTHGQFTPALYYNSGAITDLNYGLPASDPRAHDASMPNAFGGVPGIFKKFTTQAGLNYDVQIEAISGKTLQYHHTNALSVIGQAGWDKVVLQEQSTRPVPDIRGGSASLFYTYSTLLEQAIHTANPAAQVYLYQTWGRPDFTYPSGQPYSGLPIDSMTRDLHNAYYRAFTTNGHFTAVAPVGDAFLRAIRAGVAMRDPYNPDASKVNLWNVDYVHPSAWGSYLSACVLFYQLTGVDPRTLGSSEQAAAALGITPTQAVALQLTAYQQVSTPTGSGFTPGNVAVVRVGNGSAALTTAATAEFVDEYTLSGTRVQSIALPTTENGSIRAFTNSGTATSDNLTRTADGRYLLLPGYNAVPGTAGIVTTAVATNNRLVARVAADGSVDTDTRITDAFSASNIRSAVSTDGSMLYVSGGNSGIRYLPFGNTGTTTALSSSAIVNFRILGIAGGNLYASSAANANYGLNQIGTGLPTTAGAAVTVLPGFPTTSGPSPYGFYFADMSSTVTGMDVVYVTDDNTTGGIQKWSLVGGTWTLNGTIGGSTTALLRGLTGFMTGTSVQLVASGGGGLYKVTDNAGYNVAPTTTTLPAPFVVPAANTSFRGVAPTPVAMSTAPNSTALVSTSQSPAAGSVPYATPVTVTLNLGGTPLVGEYFYLIYSADGFFSKTALAPTSQSGTTVTFTLPNTASVSNANPGVRYFMISSSVATAAAEMSAGYPYINILNASGANYGYTYNSTPLSSTSRLPATTTMPYGSPVTVTLNLGGTPQAGEYFYLIYTNNGFTTRTVIAPSAQSGTTVTFTLPSATAGVAYFLISSPATTAAAEISANYPYIRILNNSGGNYGYGIGGLCGAFTIDNTSGVGTSGTNFNSFTDAVTALRTYGITCATTLTVKDGTTYTEVVPALGSATLNASLSATNTLTFVRSNTTSAKPILNAGTGTGPRDAVFTLAGADYVTLDGLDFREGSGNGTGATAATEYGLWFTHRTATDGCQNNTVRNCSITLNNAAASAPVGVQFSTSTSAGVAAPATSAAGANSYNTLYANTISNVQQGIVLLGNTSSFFDIGNTVAPTNQPGNAITFGNGGTSGIDANGQQDLVIGSNTITSTTTGNSGLLQGIVLQSGNVGTLIISGNTVKGLTGSGSVIGIVGNGRAMISRNKVVDLVTTGSGATTTGLSAAGGTLTASNNLVGDLRATASTSSSAVVGIDATTGTWHLYNNTVYLASSTSAVGSAFATSGVLFGVNPVDLRNNLIVNKSIAGLTGSTVALRGTAAGAAANLAGTTNHNLYYASTLYGEGTNAELLLTNRQATLAGYRTFMSPRETAAVSENVAFVSTTSAAATYLHVSASVPTVVESGGTTITGVATDYDGDLRYSQAGYPGTSPNALGQTLGGGNAPDLGADEGAFVPAVVSWTGNTSTDWFEITNWNGYLPTVLVDVTIPATVASGRMPVINSNTLIAAAHTLTLQGAGANSGSLTMNGTSQLKLSGELITPNATAFTAASGTTTTFLGTSAQSIGAGTYGKLVLSGTTTKVLAGPIIVGQNLDLSAGMLTLGAYNATLDGTGTVTGAGADHFVVINGVGKLAYSRVGTGASGGTRGSAFFPIGTADSYTPASLTNTGTADTFSATVQTGVPNTSATTHYVNKQWDISEGTPGGSNVSLTLQWNEADEIAGFDRTQSAIAHFEDGAWSAQCRTCFQPASGSGPYTQTRSGLSSFSPFAVEDDTRPLPVSLTRFEATRKGNNVELSWATASETNNKGFEILVSSTGKDFRVLHFSEPASANSISPREYAYTDREDSKAGLRYYLLRQLDLNGTASLSSIRTVNFGQPAVTSLSVAPNPLTDQLTVTVQVAKALPATLLTISDLRGRTVRTEQLALAAGTSTITLANLESLPAGIYLLHLNLDGQMQRVKLLKQ